VLGDLVEVPIVVKQWKSVLDGDGCDHTIQGCADCDAFLTEGSIDLRRKQEGGTRHREKEQRLEEVFGFAVV